MYKCQIKHTGQTYRPIGYICEDRASTCFPCFPRDAASEANWSSEKHEEGSVLPNWTSETSPAGMRGALGVPGSSQLFFFERSRDFQRSYFCSTSLQWQWFTGVVSCSFRTHDVYSRSTSWRPSWMYLNGEITI